MQYSSEGINEQKNKIEENLKYICDNIAKMKGPNHLKRFIMDITESITSDVREQIMEKEKNNKRNNYKNTLIKCLRVVLE